LPYEKWSEVKIRWRGKFASLEFFRGENTPDIHANVSLLALFKRDREEVGSSLLSKKYAYICLPVQKHRIADELLKVLASIRSRPYEEYYRH
jgi:hypothetical protein